MWRVDGQPPCPVTNKENIALVHVKYNLNVWFLLQGNAHVLRCHHCRKMVTKYRYSHSGYLYIYIHISMNPYRVTPLLCNGAVALSDLYMLPRTCLWNRASSVSVQFHLDAQTVHLGLGQRSYEILLRWRWCSWCNDEDAMACVILLLRCCDVATVEWRQCDEKDFLVICNLISMISYLATNQSRHVR